MPDRAAGPIFHVAPKAGLADRMVQYLVALQFRHLVPGSRISNVQIPAWDIDHPPLPLEEPVEHAGQHHHVEMAGLAERARSGAVRSIVYSGFGQRLDNFPSVDICRAAFRAPVVSPAGFGERYLICHVDGAEIVYGVSDPHCPLTPIAFYAAIVDQTGLIPVFVGQTAPNDYMDRLRTRFPHGVFLDPGDPVLAFELLRQAKHVVFGVSLFAWLAAWLSYADRIDMPVSGLFNPMQCELLDLLPYDDPRYRFTLFPINYAVPIDQHADLHRRIAPLCRPVPAPLLRRMFHAAPRFEPPSDAMAALLDAAYYLKANADVAAVYGADNAPGALEHYRVAGIRERRMPFALSVGWYAGRYPMAAMEVGQGDYSTLAHHYAAVGRARGYRTHPDGAGTPRDAARDEQPPAGAHALAVLAREIVAVEQPRPLPDWTPVRLGDSFATLLPPGIVAAFAARRTAELLRVYRLRDVMLDASLMALFNRRHPISETLYMATPEDYDYAIRKPLHPEQTDPAAHYIVGGNVAAGNYYHWMTQSLPAIDWGLRHRRHPVVVLALPPLLPWQEATLALLGHAGVPRLTLLPSAHYALASAEFSEFLGERFARIVSPVAAETYARLRNAVTPAPGGAAEIYVARTDSNRRVAVNEAALIAMLERQGVRIIVPGALPAPEQLAAFRAARLVIGPHGAGLSNLMACVPGTHVYELVPSHYPNVCFNRLAQACGLSYWADVFPGSGGPASVHDGTWRIDLDTVAARLDAIRAHSAAERAGAE